MTFLRPLIGAIFVALVYVAGMNLFFMPAQARLWNRLSAIDLLVMIALVIPFVVTRWLLPFSLRATRIAWYLCAVMAVDIAFFAIMILAPTGGHPSLEALVLVSTGSLKIVLAPTAILALGVALANGERISTIALGVTCVVCESVYTLPYPNHPFHWLLFRYWMHGTS